MPPLSEQKSNEKAWNGNTLDFSADFVSLENILHPSVNFFIHKIGIMLLLPTPTALSTLSIKGHSIVDYYNYCCCHLIPDVSPYDLRTFLFLI